ncbi:MAG TPA: thiamine pyrophosphate-requiring protein [Thermodesulfobacteriota bacterium]|nr:thiamine pyrophosphate-requiring protein [Thermodesulfobacteriota bacterium]
MDGKQAIAKILRIESVHFVTCFPFNPIIDAVAAEGIRPVMPRTERVAVGIADGFTRASFGRFNGVCLVQVGAGSENQFAGVAQAFSDSVPILLLPSGYDRRELRRPQFVALNNYRAVTKWLDMAHFADQIPTLMRRAFVSLRTGRPGPVMLEIPSDVASEQFDDRLFQYSPVKGWRSAGDPADIKRVATALIAAKNPVIRAGNGILYANAWDELREFAELLQIPVFTTMQGKSAFSENHPLSLGTGGRTRTKMVMHFLKKADIIFAIGSSCTKELFTTNLPEGKILIQSTIDEIDIAKDYPVAEAVIGDAKHVLRQLIDEVKLQTGLSKANSTAVVKEISAVKEEWLREWMPKLTSEEVPINPYRVIWELNQTVDKAKTIITHESGGPRDQLIPFYEVTTPGGYIGWGKTTTLGGSLGFALGAKLANPTKMLINLMGDASVGMAGLDFETAVREKIPILTVVLNNSKFGGYEKMLPIATERYSIDRVGGDYTGVAKALGFYAERIERPADVVPAIKRGLEIVAEGQPAFIELITRVDTDFSLYT